MTLDTGGDQGSRVPWAAGLVLVIRHGAVVLSRTVDSHPSCGCGNVLSDPDDLVSCDCGPTRYHLRQAGKTVTLYAVRGGKRTAQIVYVVPD